jgi:hypothetical protein
MQNGKFDDLVAQYIAAWNETDPQARRARVERLYTEDAQYIDPLAVASSWSVRSMRTTTRPDSVGSWGLRARPRRSRALTSSWATATGGCAPCSASSTGSRRPDQRTWMSGPSGPSA